MTRNEILFSQLGELDDAERAIALEAIEAWKRRLVGPYRPPWGTPALLRQVTIDGRVVGFYPAGTPEQEIDYEESLRFGWVNSNVRSKSPQRPQ